MATILINVWLGVSLLFVPVAYNFWANLATDIFLTLFWLISFAVLAAATNKFGSGLIYVGLFDTVDFKNYIPWQTGAAACGLGGLELYVSCPTSVTSTSNERLSVLFVVTLILFGLNLHKTRTAGVSTTAGAAPVTQEPKYQATAAPAQPTIQPVGQPGVAPTHSAMPQQPQQPYVSPPAQQAYPENAAPQTYTSGATAPTSGTAGNYSSDPEAVPQTTATGGHFTNQPVASQATY